MRTLLGIMSLLFLLNNSYAQFEYSLNKSELIKILKVKNIRVYDYYSNLDSFLTSESKFDRRGNLMVEVDYSAKGTQISKDTFLYNSNGLLFKKIGFDNQRIKSTSFVEYDSIGRVFKQIGTDDSTSFTSTTLYDKDGRHSTVIYYFKFNNQNTDTTILDHYFDKKGQLIKTVAFSKSEGTTHTNSFTYNRAGRITKRKTDSPYSSSYSFTKVTGNVEIFQTSTTRKSDKRVTQDKLQSIYYSNGLIFQRDFYANNKAISVKRFYYTFY